MNRFRVQRTNLIGAKQRDDCRMKEPIVRKHTRQMEIQEMPKSSLRKVRCGLMEGDLLSAELTVLLLLSSAMLLGIPFAL